MWKRVFEAWYSVALNVLEELNNPMPRTIAERIKQMEMQRILNLIYDVGLQVCSCVFNGMCLSMLLCFYWNAFNIHIQLLSDYTLILFIETKWHDNLITCMEKHRP